MLSLSRMRKQSELKEREILLRFFFLLLFFFTFPLAAGERSKESEKLWKKANRLFYGNPS